MKKFIIKQRIVSFQYVVVEANTAKEALKHIPFLGDEVVTDKGYFTNIEAKPFESGSLVHCSKFHFIVVTRKNLFNSIRKFFAKMNFKPMFTEIKEDKIRTVLPGNPVYSKPK